MIAISTAWNARRHTDARGVIAEIRSAGFTHVELNVHLSDEMVRDVEKLVRSGEIAVLSLHNYCPIPDGFDRLDGGGGLFPFSADDAEIRALAVRWTRNTIETAARLGAKMLVGHWGHVELPGAFEAQRDAALAARAGAAPHKALEAMAERSSEIARPFVDRALDTFSRVVPTARENGIRLGVENRNYFFEIPSLEEIGEFLALAPDVAGYWHDMGHALILEWLGVERPRAFALRWAPQAIAIHVHDVLDGNDHLPLGAGAVDFAAELAPFPKDIPRIIESHFGTIDEIRTMRETLERLQVAH